MERMQELRNDCQETVNREMNKDLPWLCPQAYWKDLSFEGDTEWGPQSLLTYCELQWREGLDAANYQPSVKYFNWTNLAMIIHVSIY